VISGDAVVLPSRLMRIATKRFEQSSEPIVCSRKGTLNGQIDLAYAHQAEWMFRGKTSAVLSTLSTPPNRRAQCLLRFLAGALLQLSSAD